MALSEAFLPSLSELESPRSLDPSDLNLSLLPSCIAQLRGLKVLDLSKRSNLSLLRSESPDLSEAFLPSLSQLESLRSLDLSDLNLSLLPSCIAQLRALKVLDLSKCSNLSLLRSESPDLSEAFLSTDTTEALLQLFEPELQTSLNQPHHGENPDSAPADRVDEFAIEEVASESSSRVMETSSVAPINVDTPRPEIHCRNPEVFGKRVFVIGNFSFEILGSALSQVSSPNKPEFALAGLVISLVAVLVCIVAFGWKAQRAKVIIRQWGQIWWFYYPPPSDRVFGTFADIFGLSFAILQTISSAIDFGFFHRHADNPVKISLYPVIFAALMVGSEFINNPSELSGEGYSVVDRGEEAVEIVVEP